MNSFSFDDFGHDREIPVAGVGGRTHICLINLSPRDFAYWNHISRAGGHGDQWLKSRQIDLLVHVVVGIRVGYQFGPVCFASLRLQEAVYFSIGGKNRSRRSQFRSHVGDHVAIHRGESGKAWSVIFDDTADAAANIVPPQHFQDHVLRANPVRERSRQV